MARRDHIRGDDTQLFLRSIALLRRYLAREWKLLDTHFCASDAAGEVSYLSILSGIHLDLARIVQS
ncbi:hypothetical protein AAV28_28980 [Bradyrhizobium diazoefficiens USDA 110]|nr:hypothetical protein AAV28_28980 [Bradyrhizobium diazoefficiens USDA 110]MDA9389343.1 hypothetical protein [Bradyrhizobium sp. CCBAU 45394]MDA9540208.1 hypothetical protein [Bradyrhizobium sp. CCBAU 21362]